MSPSRTSRTSRTSGTSRTNLTRVVPLLARGQLFLVRDNNSSRPPSPTCCTHFCRNQFLFLVFCSGQQFQRRDLALLSKVVPVPVRDVRDVPDVPDNPGPPGQCPGPSMCSGSSRQTFFLFCIATMGSNLQQERGDSSPEKTTCSSNAVPSTSRNGVRLMISSSGPRETTASEEVLSIWSGESGRTKTRGH
mgnify:CR=1 FL=1